MKKISELHEKHNIHPELSDFHLTFQYNHIINDWRFMGYRCIKCNTLIKHPGTVPKHPLSCKGMNKRGSKEEKAYIVKNDGTEWQPYDFNQNFSY